MPAGAPSYFNASTDTRRCLSYTIIIRRCRKYVNDFSYFLPFYNFNLLPLRQNTPIDEAALIVVLDHSQDYCIALAEVPVGVLGGVEAQAGGAVRHGAEHAAAVLPADDRLTPAAQRVADYSPVKGVGGGLLDGNTHPAGGPVILLEDAVIVLARAVHLPQIVIAGVADIPETQGEVPASALHQTTVGADSQDTAGQPFPRLMAPMRREAVATPPTRSTSKIT